MSCGGLSMMGGPRESPPSSKGVRGPVASVALDKIVSRSFSVLLSAGSELHHRKAAAALVLCTGSFRAVLATGAAILLLSACSSNPPIISGDTSCERFRHISATPAQIKVFADNWEVMESYADQVVSHNLEYDRNCLGVAP